MGKSGIPLIDTIVCNGFFFVMLQNKLCLQFILYILYIVCILIHGKNEGSGDIIPANFLDFPPNFRLRTRY